MQQYERHTDTTPLPAAQLHLSFLGTGRYAAGYPALLSAMRSGWLLVAGVRGWGDDVRSSYLRAVPVFEYMYGTSVRSSVCRFIGDILIYMY